MDDRVDRRHDGDADHLPAHRRLPDAVLPACGRRWPRCWPRWPCGRCLAKNWHCTVLFLCWCSALDCCTALCCRLMPRPTRNTTSTRALRWPAAGPTTCPTTSGGWVRCPRRRASAASVTRTPTCKTRTRRSLRGRRSPPSCSPPQTSPLTAIRNIMNCRPTRTRFCTSSVRRQYFWPMCCILALRPRCFWGGLQICCSLRRWRRWRSRPRRSASGSLPWPRCCP